MPYVNQTWGIVGCNVGDEAPGYNERRNSRHLVVFEALVSVGSKGKAPGGGSGEAP